MYLSDIKGESVKKCGALVLISASPLLLIWTRCDRWSLSSSLSFLHPRMLSRGVMDARGPGLGCRSLAASGSHGSIVLNAVINHTRTGGHAVLNTASHPHICGGASALGTENTLYLGYTGHCPSKSSARRGNTAAASVQLFWQPHLAFREPHVCLISRFISWSGHWDYMGLI